MRAGLLLLLLPCLAAGAAAAPRSDRPSPGGCRGFERALVALERAGRPAGARGAASLVGWQRRALQELEARYADRCVTLDQIQVLGTHNSYHLEPERDVLRLLTAFDPALLSLEYSHVPIAEQLESQGIRQLELDVFADPEGGLYSQRRILAVLRRDPASGLPELDRPGLKVLHVQDVDYLTTCLTFVACLEAVKRWSDDHPGHLPILILVEAKADPIPDPLELGFTVPLPFGAREFRDLDAEVLSVFPPSQLLLPDDVRGRRASLDQAVRRDGWPTLGELRGRVLLALDNEGQGRRDYLDGHAALEERVLFTASTPGEPDAGFVKLNDAIADGARIRAAVRAGYLVRTRADADTLEARTGDTRRRDAALASGAHFVSTDYPVPDPDFATGYRVEIPGGAPARCNPVRARPACRASALERLR
jgi:hypothetical protein